MLKDIVTKFKTTHTKLLAALIGAGTVAVSQGLLDGTAAKLFAVGVACLTAGGVYRVPNQ